MVLGYRGFEMGKKRILNVAVAMVVLGLIAQGLPHVAAGTETILACALQTGTTPTIDGNYNTDEWSDADSYTFT